MADAQAVAWLAYNAAETGDRSVIPRLERALASLNGDERPGQSMARQALVDALIRLDAAPSLGLIERLFERHPVEALLFLKRSGPERNQTALALLERSSGYRWFALARLLEETKAEGLAAHLLAGLRVRLSVSVSEDGNRGVGHVEGFGVSCGCGASGLAPGFPPLATYRFASPSDGGTRVLTGGVRPTSYRRHVSGLGMTPVASDCDILGPTVRDRLDQLAALLPGTSQVLRAHESESIAWAGPADLRKLVTAAVGRIHAAYRSRVWSLQEAGWVTASDAARLQPTIGIDVHDLRRDMSEPLPDVTP